MASNILLQEHSYGMVTIKNSTFIHHDGNAQSSKTVANTSNVSIVHAPITMTTNKPLLVRNVNTTNDSAPFASNVTSFHARAREYDVNKIISDTQNKLAAAYISFELQDLFVVGISIVCCFTVFVAIIRRQINSKSRDSIQ